MLAAASKLDEEERGHIARAVTLLGEALFPDVAPFGASDPNKVGRRQFRIGSASPSEQVDSPSEQA